jgi:hypothetical protein
MGINCVAYGFEVRLPCIFHGRLEGNYEHALGPEFPGELIGGEGRAVVALSGLIEYDGVVLDVGGLELLGDTLRVVWPTLSRPACALSAMV